ncbi:MAG: hypothetical protein ACJ74Q_15020 [Pyrinomonadaceae bacterium]
MSNEGEQRTITVPAQFRIAPQEGLDAESLAHYLREVLALCFRFVEFREGAVEQLVIADEDRFGEAVFEFQRQAGRQQVYTDRGYFRAVTKNIPREVEGGGVTSTIVIDSRIFYRLSEIIESGVPLEEWDTNHQFWLHIFVNEFARSLDHAERADVGDAAEFNFEEEHDYLRIAAHYAPAVVNNFFASALAAAAVTPQLQAKQVSDLHDSARDIIRPLLDRKIGGPAGWGNLLRDAANAFWSLLTLYGQLIGHVAGNSSLGPVQPWPHAGDEAAAALDETASVLRRLWDMYPTVPQQEEITEQLLTPWRKLTASHGFIFNGDEEEETAEEGE